MKTALLLLTIFLCATAGAQVYKRIGPDGQVYFSDQPGADAEPVELSPPQVISVPPLPERRPTAVQRGGGAEKQDDSAFSYTRFSVTSPTKYQGYRANDGNITVRLSLEPALRPGHTVVLNVDGEDGEMIRTGGGMAIELQNLSRGQHTVWAKVVDDKGRELIRTEPVSFYILRVARGGG